jgi:hypothetical protein
LSAQLAHRCKRRRIEPVASNDVPTNYAKHLTERRDRSIGDVFTAALQLIHNDPRSLHAG